jgi:hypothetical protein
MASAQPGVTRGEYLGALCRGRDAVVEPRTAQRALRVAMLSRRTYRWVPGSAVVDVGGAGLGTITA